MTFLAVPYVPDTVDSEFNDGQGIRYVLNFTPFIKNAKKKRKKVPSVAAKVLYLHENTQFSAFVNKIFAKIGRNSAAIALLDLDTGELDDSKFSISFLIKRHVTVALSLSSQLDYADMIQQAKKKADPEVMLEIAEAEVCHPSYFTFFTYCCQYSLLKTWQVLMMNCLLTHQRSERKMYVYACLHLFFQ